MSNQRQGVIMLSRFSQQFPHFFQPTCLLCGCKINRTKNNKDPQNTGFYGLCEYCHLDLPWNNHSCSICAIPLEIDVNICGSCMKSPPFYDSSICPVNYEWHLPKLVHILKNHHDMAVCRLLSELISSNSPNHGKNIDCIIPVPMHIKRNLMRGNNHSYLLAKHISKSLNIPLKNALLQRHKSSDTQKNLNSQQRHQNLKNNFSTQFPLIGLNIAVIDDVITTGSTMNEIAKTLKQAGANTVHCWAVARTPKR